jgi:hypothetical protein
MAILLFIIAAFMALGALATLTSIGKPRPVITRGVATFSFMISVFFIVVITIAAFHYSS